MTACQFAVWLRELQAGLFNNLEGWDEDEGWRDGPEGRDLGMPVADSCWCLAETNTVL